MVNLVTAVFGRIIRLLERSFVIESLLFGRKIVEVQSVGASRTRDCQAREGR